MKLKQLFFIIISLSVLNSCKKEEPETAITSDFKLELISGNHAVSSAKLGYVELAFMFYKKGEPYIVYNSPDIEMNIDTEILENTTGENDFIIKHNYPVHSSLNYFCQMPASPGIIKVRFFNRVNNIESGNSVVVEFTVTDTSTTWTVLQLPYINRIMEGQNGSILALGLGESFYTNNYFSSFVKLDLPYDLWPGGVTSDGHFLLFNNNVLYDFDPSTKSYSTRVLPFNIKSISISGNVIFYGTGNDDLIIESTPEVYTYMNNKVYNLEKVYKSQTGQIFAITVSPNYEHGILKFESDTSSTFKAVSPESPTTLQEIILHNNKLYAFSSSGIFTSDNLGENWSKLCDMPIPNLRAYEFYVKNDKFYITYTNNVEVYYSSSLDNPSFTRLKVTPFDIRFFPLNDGNLLVSRRSNYQLIVPTP